jgi:hypothetical protein
LGRRHDDDDNDDDDVVDFKLVFRPENTGLPASPFVPKMHPAFVATRGLTSHLRPQPLSPPKRRRASFVAGTLRNSLAAAVAPHIPAKELPAGRSGFPNQPDPPHAAGSVLSAPLGGLRVERVTGTTANGHGIPPDSLKYPLLTFREVSKERLVKAQEIDRIFQHLSHANIACTRETLEHALTVPADMPRAFATRSLPMPVHRCCRMRWWDEVIERPEAVDSNEGLDAQRRSAIRVLSKKAKKKKKGKKEAAKGIKTAPASRSPQKK